jgi:DNA modification methylase
VADIWHGALHARTITETTGRICYGVELNPAYVDVAIERWQAFTGEDAVLVETGESFAALKKKRMAA